jgi:transposase
MWKTENRGRYDRSKLRYPSDLTDEEWSLVGPLIPPAKRGGNRRTVDVREVVNGIMYVLSTGCQWAALPKDLPPRSTVNSYFLRWEHDRTLDRLHYALYIQCREQAGQHATLRWLSIGFADGTLASSARRSRSSTARASRARKKMLWGGRRGIRHHRRCQATDGEPHVSC